MIRCKCKGGSKEFNSIGWITHRFIIVCAISMEARVQDEEMNSGNFEDG